MRLVFSGPFIRQYNKLPAPIRKKIDRQLRHLVKDIRHPGLYAKKMAGASDIWEARVDYHYRFTFKVVKGRAILRKVGIHDILRKP